MTRGKYLEDHDLGNSSAKRDPQPPGFVKTSESDFSTSSNNDFMVKPDEAKTLYRKQYASY